MSPAALAEDIRAVAAGRARSSAAADSVRGGVTAARSIDAAPRMVARLSADQHCRIEPKDPLDRAVVSGERIRWRWSVTPAVAGPLMLTATLTAPVVIDGKETSYGVQSFDETVTVVVTNPQRFSDFLDWMKTYWVLVTAATAGALAVLRYARTLRKNRDTAAPSPE